MTNKTIKFQEMTFDPDSYLQDLLRKKEDFSEEQESPQMFINSPMGIESILDPFSLTRHFKFYIGHTNFSISRDVFFQIEKIPGVDILRKMTRYRFLIAFGELFDPEEVQEEIVQSLCDDQPDEFEELLTDLATSGKKYAVYINGEDFRYTTEEDKNFEAMKAIFREAKEKNGGEIVEG